MVAAVTIICWVITRPITILLVAIISWRRQCQGPVSPLSDVSKLRINWAGVTLRPIPALRTAPATTLVTTMAVLSDADSIWLKLES